MTRQRIRGPLRSWCQWFGDEHCTSPTQYHHKFSRDRYHPYRRLHTDITFRVQWGNYSGWIAIWVPSQSNWLQNLNTATVSINGELTASVDLPGGGVLFAGSLSSSQLSANGAVSLASNALSSLPIHIQPAPAQSSLSKRATSSQNISGVATGLFYNNGGRNVTILGGHFTATGTNGSSINNLVFINGSDSNTVIGVGSQLSSDSTVLALGVQGDTLYAGGSLTGTVDGAKVDD